MGGNHFLTLLIADGGPIRLHFLALPVCRDAQTSGVFLVALAVGVVVPAGAASADIWIGVRVPPNPVVPPPTEEVWRVQQPAPVNVQVVFVPNPGAPSVSVPNPGPPG